MMLLGFALLLLLGLGFVVLPLYSRKVKQNDISGEALNTQLFKERVAELDAEFAGGSLTQEQYNELKTELSKTLLADTQPEAAVENHLTLPAWVVPLVGVVFIIAAAGFYRFNADVEQVFSWEEKKASAGTMVDELLANNQVIPDDLDEQSYRAAALVLQQRLQTQPDNGFGWYALGIAGMRLGHAQHAISSLRRAYHLEPNSATRVTYAQALMTTNEGKLEQTSRKLLLEALGENPADQRALLLLGFGSFNAERYDDAVWAWRQLLLYTEAGSERAQLLERSIEKAELMLAKANAGGDAQADASSPSLDIAVSLSAELAGKLKGNESLIVFAKAVDGPPAPLAAVRLSASQLPATIRLSDANAMVQGMNLSSAKKVILTARVSSAGGVRASSGDLQGVSAPIDVIPGLQKLVLEIDQVVP